VSLTITARSVITGALRALGVADATAPPTAEDMQTGYDALQELVDNWSTQNLTSLLQERTVYSLVANQQTYTIGPLALAPDWSTGTAPRPLTIDGAGLILTVATPATEIPLALYDDQGYQALKIKELTSPLPTGLIYHPLNPLGEVILWPTPTDASNEIVLYTALLTAQFTSLSASYLCPPGYAKALRFNLAKVLVADFAVPDVVEARVTREADQSLSDLKRVNVQIVDVSLDPALVGSEGGYNIWTD